MTGLTSQLKVDGLETQLPPKSTEPYPEYTNFSGYYPGITGITQKELAEDLEYADSVRRHEFW